MSLLMVETGLISAAWWKGWWGWALVPLGETHSQVAESREGPKTMVPTRRLGYPLDERRSRGLYW
jgi:hypothetical protein